MTDHKSFITRRLLTGETWSSPGGMISDWEYLAESNQRSRDWRERGGDRETGDILMAEPTIHWSDDRQ